MDVQGVLLAIYMGITQERPWNYELDCDIDEYAMKFFDIVNVWIYNDLISHNINHCVRSDIEYTIVDWLLGQPEIGQWVKNEFEKRKVTRMLSKISLNMNENSTLLEYYWNEYYLKGIQGKVEES